MNLKKQLVLFLFLSVFLFSAASQVSVNPSDPIYTDISNWENFGIITNVPPLRPYPLTLITSFLKSVMECEYPDQAAKARAHYERIFGKSVDIGFEVADNNKLSYQKVDSIGQGGVKVKENEIDVKIAVAGDIKATDYLSVGVNTNILVTDGLEKKSLPTFVSKSYDAVNDSTDLKFAKAFLDMNITAAIGNEKIYFQGGISRNSFGPFYEDSVALNPNAYHTGNASFVFRDRNWSYTQAMFMLGATNDLGSSLKPNKFMMMHSIDVSPFSWLSFSYYENVIYGGRFDPIYMLPFVPYMVAQGIGSFNDNVQMGVTLKIRPAVGFTWMTDVFVDDMSASDIAKLRLDTKFRFGGMTGVVYSPLDSVFSEVSANYTMIAPYMYSHEQFADDKAQISVGNRGTNFQNYTNNGKSMGSNLPPNSDRFAFKIKAEPYKNLKFTFAANMIRHSNINELLVEKAGTEADKYFTLPSIAAGSVSSGTAPGVLLTDGSVLNHPYSYGAYDYAWNHFMFMESATRMYVWQADFDAEYSLPWEKLGQLTIHAGYTFEYIKNNGVQANMFPYVYNTVTDSYTPVYATSQLAYNAWKANLRNDINHYFRISLKYMYGL